MTAKFTANTLKHLHVMITYLHAILKSLDRIRRQLDATKHAPLTLS